MVSITDTFAVEQEGYLVFDLALEEALPFGQSVTVAIEAREGTATQGPSQLFDADQPAPFDFADKEFEFSLDEGTTWIAAEKGNQVTFGFGLVGLKVRLPINDDALNEGPIPETVELRVTDVVIGSADLGDLTDIGIGSIIDDDVPVLPKVAISDVTVTEGEDSYAVLDVKLSSSVGERTVLKLETGGGEAQPGRKEDIGSLDSLGNPIDYASDEVEVSYDQGNTWERAPANQIEIPKGTVDLTQVRIAIGDDDVIEPDESFDVSVATVVAGSVDAAVASATVTIVDDDTALPPFIQTFQAEDAVLVGAVVKPGREAEGRGYVDYTNSSGDYAEWTVDVPKTGVYELSWRYQNGSSNRPLALDVNGSMLNPNVDFLNTGGWTKRDWASVSQSVALEAGSNTIRLTATGQSGANFDSMTVSNIDSSLLAVAPTEAPTSLASLEPEGADAIAQRDDITGLSVTADAFSIEAADPLADSLLAAPAPTARSFASRSLASQPLAMRSTALPVQPLAAQSLAIQSTAASPEAFAVEATTASAFDTTLQAEDALVSGPDINTGRGSEGTGYVDYRNSSGDFIEWTVDAPTAGAYELSWRYQNGSSNRPLALEVNGNAANPGVDFPNTGGWNRDSWDFVSQAVTLDAGPNIIRLTAIGQSGANFDYMRVVFAGSDVIISDATATEGVDDYLVFDVSLSVASEDIVTLELAAVDGTAKGGLIAEFSLDPTGDPVDYANAEFEVEVITDGVATWQAATNGTEVTFAAGETERKIRLAINDDGASESTVPETLQLTVNSVLAGDVRSFSDTGTGSIVDDELPAPDVLISDATATEGIDDYLVFDVSLSVPSDEPITVALTAMDGTAKGGAIADFPLDLAGDPVDYAKTEFEVSIDGGATWTATANGEVTFAAGTTERKVRLAINDDEASENDVESLQLFSSIVSGEVGSTADTGTGSIVDNEIPAPDVLISDASATEGTDDYLVFNISLSAASEEDIGLDLVAANGTAKGGAIADFPLDLAGDPVDYANVEFEVEVITDGVATWQAATNGTEITFAAGEIERRVRLAINDDQAPEGAVAETLQLSVGGVTEGEVGDITAVGTGSIIDDEIIDPGTVFDVTLQAEDAVIAGPDVGTGRGSEGTGYVDYRNRSGDYIEWTVNAPSAGAYELSWRYQNGSSNRPLALDINGNTVSPSVDFPNTGGWNASDWTLVSQAVSLDAGPNTVRLTAIGQSGANFDYMNVVAIGTDVLISDATATEGTDDYLVFDVSLSAASDEAITLDLAAVDGTAKGGVIADFPLDPTGDPVDYANAEFEVSADGGATWTAATNGTEVTFIAGEIERRVRLAINDDEASESAVAETLQLTVASVLAGDVRSFDNTGTGSIADNELPAPDVLISDASATEGTDDYLVFDVSLSAASDEVIGVDLTTIDGTAKGGAIADFNIDPFGDPVDYANAEFEVSTDGGVTWQAATNGTEVTFAAGETERKVRLLINDDQVAEGAVAESLQLAVSGITTGEVGSTADAGNGQIIDNEIPDPGTPPISTLPGPAIRVEGNVNFSFDGQDGGLLDGDVDDIGFTMVDPSSNPGNPNPVGGIVGYWAEKLNVTDGVLKIDGTNGLQARGSNNLDNALGIGLNVPSQDLTLKTTLVDLPAAGGGFAQGGLWFGQATQGGSGTSEDNYIKLVAISPTAGDYQLQALIEEAGQITKTINLDIPDDVASVDLQLALDVETRTVRASYALPDGTLQTLTNFTGVPDAWFSFDQAGLDPNIATRSFGGVLASRRFSSSEQVFSFEDFSATEGPLDFSGPGTPDPDPDPDPDTEPDQDLSGDFSFDKWQIPLGQTTAMALGPDGRLYVATIFGTIKAFDIDPETRTFTEETIQTIKTDEGGNRLTLGIAVDPESTPDNVILWVGHSDGSIRNGEINSGKVSRLSGPNFSQKDDIVTGLPRAIANHALNNIDFGPDGNLYLWYGGNTGAGSANTEPTEFGDRPEQNLAAALLKVDVQSWKADPAGFESDASSPIGEFLDEFYARKAQELGREYTEVTVFATGLRNTYDGVFHSNGNIYAPDNGLGAIGTTPPVPRLGDPTDRSITTLFGEVPVDNPGVQTDPLNLIVEGGYYGHPNPYRDEVVFKDGSFQGFSNADGDPTNDIPAGHPEYTPPFLTLGTNQSANGIIEYTADNFFGQLQGDLLITSFSKGDNIIRVQLTEDGLAPVGLESLIGGFVDPLPIAMGQNGTDLEGLLFVGEFNGGGITVLESLGTWRDDLPSLPNAAGVLDAGSAVIGDQLYLVGGKTDTGPISDVYVYTPGDPIDATDDTWTTLPSTLPGTAVENPAVVAYDGKLYTFGGSTGPFSGAVSNAAVYDPATALWTALADMPTARGGAQAAVLNDKIYVIGGLDADGASVATAEAFDPVTGEWLSGAADPSDLQIRRDNAGIAVVEDKLHVFGGRTRELDGTTPDGGLTSMEIYDPSTDQWTFGASLLNGRRTMAVGTINGRIQAIGGEGNTSLDINEEYVPSLGAWRTLPAIATGRHGAGFGTIDGVVYVVGGGPEPGSTFTDVTEAFTF